MRKSFDLDDDGCYLQPGKKESIEECGFNATAKTILIIHGWTVRHSRLSWHVPMVLLLDLTFEDFDAKALISKITLKRLLAYKCFLKVNFLIY